MARKRKQITMTVTVSVPHWMTAAEARREVRSLITHQANYSSGRWSADGEWLEVWEKTVRASKVSAR